MKPIPNLLIVGGTGRNTGKTELVCRIISKISMQRQVYAAKTSEIAPSIGSPSNNALPDGCSYHIYEEKNRKSDKDTARMLNAGAHQVFYLRSDDKNIAEGFTKLLDQIPQNIPLICESNTLAKYFKPALYLVVTQGDTKQITFRERLKHADAVITSDGWSGFAEVDAILFTNNKWLLHPHP